MTDPRIHNPILRGFNADPSFCRVGDDYFIATSTFEWFPGVPIHHSRDLVHWHLVGHGLATERLLDLAGVGDSGGVWAPSLSHADGLFHLVYSIVRTRAGVFKDVHNYVTTATDIQGPWSDPVFLNSSGFDPSLFHDEDGRKWVVNLQWDFRKSHPSFAGIIAQEYDPEQRRLVGPINTLLRKSELIEGPNLYKWDGFYYLLLAEGGTGWNHGISMARSRSLHGPYELDPQGSVLTARDDEAIPLQKAGHGELVQTPAGDWYLAHLASRPVGPNRRCMMGRETCLQRVVWSPDGWLRLEHGGTRPQETVTGPPELPPCSWPAEPARDDFDADTLGPHWSALRVPIDETWATQRERRGWLRLRGRESLHSLFAQSLLAKRLQEARCRAETCLEFAPAHFSQMAGLICWYDTRTHYYLRVTHDEQLGKILGIVLTDNGVYDELPDSQIAVGDWGRCFLRADIDRDSLQFSASPDGEAWQPVGLVLDASKLSDDYGQGPALHGRFCRHLCAGSRRHKGRRRL